MIYYERFADEKIGVSFAGGEQIEGFLMGETEESIELYGGIYCDPQEMEVNLIIPKDKIIFVRKLELY